MNLAALLFDVARRLPGHPAVSDGRHAWSYGELAARVARVAGGLRANGLVPGDRVLLSLENCAEFFELLFGCWAAQLCAVPANARLHPREVEYIARNSASRPAVPITRRSLPAANRCRPSPARRPTPPGCSTPRARPAGRRGRC